MSYAQVAAKNSKQSAEEARAAPVPELEHETASTSSLVDVEGAPHVSSVPSSALASQQDLRNAPASRAERDARDATVEARLEALAASTRGGGAAPPNLSRSGGEDVGSGEREEKKKKNGAATAAAAGDKARRFVARVADGGRSLRANAAHPAVVGNFVFAVALVAGGAACFERVQRRLGERVASGWPALGLGAALLGAVGIADYYASAFLVRKYPLKK